MVGCIRHQVEQRRYTDQLVNRIEALTGDHAGQAAVGDRRERVEGGPTNAERVSADGAVAGLQTGERVGRVERVGVVDVAEQRVQVDVACTASPECR